MSYETLYSKTILHSYGNLWQFVMKMQILPQQIPLTSSFGYKILSTVYCRSSGNFSVKMQIVTMLGFERQATENLHYTIVLSNSFTNMRYKQKAGFAGTSLKQENAYLQKTKHVLFLFISIHVLFYNNNIDKTVVNGMIDPGPYRSLLKKLRCKS